MSDDLQPIDASQDGTKWMVVLSTDNPMEAHVVAGRLRSQNIETWIHQEPSGSAFGITVGALGEVRVLVHQHDYEAARAIIETEPVGPDENSFDSLLTDSDDEFDPKPDFE